MTRRTSLPVFYNCSACPAYCCSYDQIEVTKRDIARLARRFGLRARDARERFTKAADDGRGRVLRHKKDPIFGHACRFLDPKTRACTVYEHRPAICRDFPGTPRCGYYEFLTFERRSQDDEEVIVAARVTWR